MHFWNLFCLHLQMFVYISWDIFSPSEGPCCTDQCEFTNEVECGHEDECRFSVKCDGSSSFCPIALHKSDTSPCEGGSKVGSIVWKDFKSGIQYYYSILFHLQICTDGVCTSSVCAKYNMVECSLNDTNPCEVHCQVPNRPKTCKSSTELEALFAEPVFRSPGAPCDMKLEVCSKYFRCLGATSFYKI